MENIKSIYYRFLCKIGVKGNEPRNSHHDDEREGRSTMAALVGILAKERQLPLTKTTFDTTDSFIICLTIRIR